MQRLWFPIADAVADGGIPDQFPHPFDELGPAVIAREAAGRLQAELRAGRLGPHVSSSILDDPEGGKMFGVLVARAPDGSLGVLRAFSGTIAGRFDLPGYVPAVFDRAARERVEVPGERVVSALASRARAFTASTEVDTARQAAAALEQRHRRELEEMRERHRARRDERRREREALGEDPGASSVRHALDQQSRGDKAERRALDARHDEERREVHGRLRRLERRVAAHARLCGMVSRRLLREIHETYVLVNARGERRTLRELWASGEPPGGAGDCAAPKLLAYAFAHGLRPVAMAEFWWGAPPPGGGRVAGAFYPACREKCGPLLPFLLDGLDVAPPRRFTPPPARGLELRVLHEDARLVVVDKPCGLLSVPARGGSCDDSVLGRLRARCGDVLVVHRLDLDTSGLMVFARDAGAHRALQRQFLRRTVEKRYVAIVEGAVRGGEREVVGTIDLAIRVDPHDRPRQVHDPLHGRRSITHWRVIDVDTSHVAVRTRVALAPHTGRTHQLRVHCAHPLGLGCPIVGDRLYGREDGRLLLHAERLAFVHPDTGQRVSFESPSPF